MAQPNSTNQATRQNGAAAAQVAAAQAGTSGDDTFGFNISTDPAQSQNLGAGDDTVNVSASDSVQQVRVTFTSAEVGNGNANDAGTMTNQNGGLAVRMQAENGSDGLTGPVSRFDDEGISFVAQDGFTFDVRDLVSGAARGDQFDVVTLGTQSGDTISEAGETDNYYINGGMGNDTLTGGAGNDFLVGGAGDDVLRGNGGDDSFIGGGGNDSIRGDRNEDRAIFNVSTDGRDSVNLGSGLDTALISAAMGTTQVRLTFTSAEVGNISANDGGSGANQDGGLAIRLQAEDGSGELTGEVSRFDDEGISFIAQGGVKFDVRDLVSGAARGAAFDVVTLGTFGDDRINEMGEPQNYYINGGRGNDIITGGAGADFLVGGVGNDKLDGNAGNDHFIGGAGSDTIIGRWGNDTVIFNVATDGSDRVDLGSGNDRVTVAGTAGSQVRLTFTSAEVGNGFARDSDTLANQDGGLAVRMQAEDGSDGLGGATSRFDDEGITFDGRAAGVTFDVRDLVSGTERGDQFDVVRLGTRGNDITNFGDSTSSYYVNGGMGIDQLTGGYGSDFLVGGAGDDKLNGNRGDDKMIGGGGADRFIFTARPGDDSILDFASGTDRIDLRHYGISEDDVLIEQSGSDTLVFVDTDSDGTDDFQITLVGVTQDLQNSDFIF